MVELEVIELLGTTKHPVEVDLQRARSMPHLEVQRLLLQLVVEVLVGFGLLAPMRPTGMIRFSLPLPQ